MMPPIAASFGDPAGIGPELLCAAWAARTAHAVPPFVVVGSSEVLREAARHRGLPIELETVTNPAEGISVFDRALPVIDIGRGDYTPGSPSQAGAHLALAALTEAASLAHRRLASAVMTAPVSKADLKAVGFAHPGQTEFVAEASGAPTTQGVMMLAGPHLRTVPLTIHIPLSQVPGALTRDLIVERARVVAAALQADFGIAHPRLAISALNPHAGEGGAFGSEEATIIAPAVAALRAEGIDAQGPFPADALFQPRARGNYDAALCMYHDQALIPLKALDFDAGVNVTLGLSIVRTSPDHGTAFGIAGKGLADAGATIAALKLAGSIAANRARQ